jgi:hypothetical protein
MPELKITSQHLQRDAYLYIRQSTPRQVVENTESTQRQYALRDRAVALGWPLERIHVLDSDLGKSGSQSIGRVMGLEVSRLARNSADWHRLIELCSLAGALILDEDGIYDPAGPRLKDRHRVLVGGRFLCGTQDPLHQGRTVIHSPMSRRPELMVIFFACA